jgi:PadR family transcriptional regulator PadR
MTIEMREPTFFLLTALLDGPKHGYALIAEVAALSEGTLSLQVGTLYGALDRLVQQGWLSESGTEVVAGRHRRYFAITDDGVTALEVESERLRARALRATTLITRRRESFAS